MLGATLDMLRLSVATLFHPINAFTNIKKNRYYFSYFAPLIIVVFIVIVRVASIYLTNYALVDVRPEETSIINEFVRFAVPLAGWSIGSYIITAIMDGECLFKEAFTATCYCLIPYVFFMIPISLLSNVFSLQEASIYNLITFALWCWIGVLIFTSVKVLNNYLLRKTVLVCILGLVAMAIMAAILLLIYAMLNQLIELIKGIYNEIRMAGY